MNYQTYYQFLSIVINSQFEAMRARSNLDFALVSTDSLVLRHKNQRNILSLPPLNGDRQTWRMTHCHL